MIKVFIIDDALLVRVTIKKILAEYDDIEVIGEAENPVDAFEEFKQTGLPDVFILDIEMPKMDGLTFFKKLNDQNPTPVIICSTLVSMGSTSAIDALRLGAIEIIHKPNIGVRDFFIEQKEQFIKAIKTASRSKVKFKPKIEKKVNIPQDDVNEGKPSEIFIAIGSSTGGVQVIEEIVTSIEQNHKGIVITQHMPEDFTASFASRLNLLTKSKII